MRGCSSSHLIVVVSLSLQLFPRKCTWLYVINNNLMSLSGEWRVSRCLLLPLGHCRNLLLLFFFFFSIHFFFFLCLFLSGGLWGHCSRCVSATKIKRFYLHVKITATVVASCGVFDRRATQIFSVPEGTKCEPDEGAAQGCANFLTCKWMECFGDPHIGGKNISQDL